MNHLGFAAPDVATVHLVRDRMADAGFPVPEIQHVGGATALFMKDRMGSVSKSPTTHRARMPSTDRPPDPL